MSSISSYDSYDIQIEDDEFFVKKLDELDGSDSGSGSDSGYNSTGIQYKKISLREAENLLKKTTEPCNMNELNIVSLYLKCKKNVYIKASHHNKYYSNVLFMVSSVISGSLIVLPFFTSEKIAFSVVSFFSTYFVCLVKYLNYDASSMYFGKISERYSKIHLNIENFLSKIVYVSDKNAVYFEKMKEIEEKIHDLNEENVVIPSKIQTLSPFVNSINIFMAIHEREITKKRLISRYRNIINEIEYIQSKWKISNPTEKTRETDKTRMAFLTENKKKTKDEFKSLNFSTMKEILETEYNLLV
jgi:hypothetical protein